MSVDVGGDPPSLLPPRSTLATLSIPCLFSAWVYIGCLGLSIWRFLGSLEGDSGVGSGNIWPPTLASVCAPNPHATAWIAIITLAPAAHPRIRCPLPLHEYNGSSSLLYLVPLLPLPPPSVPRTPSNPRPTKGRTQHHHLWEWHTDTLCRSRDLCVVGYPRTPSSDPLALDFVYDTLLAFYKDTAASNPPSSIYNLAPTLSLRPPPASSSRTAVVALRRRRFRTCPLAPSKHCQVTLLPSHTPYPCLLVHLRPLRASPPRSASFAPLPSILRTPSPSPRCKHTNQFHHLSMCCPSTLSAFGRRRALPGLALRIPPALSDFTIPLLARDDHIHHQSLPVHHALDPHVLVNSAHSIGMELSLRRRGRRYRCPPRAPFASIIPHHPLCMFLFDTIIIAVEICAQRLRIRHRRR
ncbi:hypothetical protein R3P38DRAFT_3190818 [Favolaschia claudopus]|uniref:Uncharacterized protein n=1 Tax=Favolaschia claudopus TaxID=2862362 RepID=A0AAW0BMX0_9AGAR